jgi:hypothetical protein
MRTRYISWLILLGLAFATSAQGASGFKFESAVLYQPDEPLRARLGSAGELAAYMRRLEAVCTTFFAAEKTPERMDVVVGLKPGRKVRVWFVSSRRTSGDQTLAALRKKLEAVRACDVHGGPIAFALRCTIAGGGGPPKAAGAMPMPQEWRNAAGGKNVLVPDGVFQRIWPD